MGEGMSAKLHRDDSVTYGDLEFSMAPAGKVGIFPLNCTAPRSRDLPYNRVARDPSIRVCMYVYTAIYLYIGMRTVLESDRQEYIGIKIDRALAAHVYACIHSSLQH